MHTYCSGRDLTRSVTCGGRRGRGRGRGRSRGWFYSSGRSWLVSSDGGCFIHINKLLEHFNLRWMQTHTTIHNLEFAYTPID